MPELLIISLAVIFGAAAVAPWVVAVLGDRGGWLLSLAPFFALASLLALIGPVGEGAAVVYELEWFAALDVSLALRLDGLALMMGLLITGVGGFICLYAMGYLHGHPQLGRFYLYLLAFMGAMLGLVLSDNLILLFVFWELTSITSYLLIGFNHEEKQSRWKALQALLVTGLGAMSMLAGFVLIAMVTGSWNLSEINSLGDLLQVSPLYTAIVLLILGGAFTKSAQVPFHFWLPNAMAAPTPVSAYLHSATMVKAGVFLLARLNPCLSGTELWAWSLSLVGSFTLLLAVALGIFQTDLKRILAYTTLAVLGMLTMLLGLGSAVAIKAMVLFLIGHAFYKAALFMVAGSVDHEAGTRDVTRLSGLRAVMPITAAAALLAALSKSGFPPFIGFLGKEYVYATGVALEGAANYFLVAAFIGNLLIMAMALCVAISPFFGSRDGHGALPKKPHEAPLTMWIGPLSLGLLGLAVGLFPDLIANSIVGPAIAAIKGVPVKPLEIKLWHGVNLPLLLSLLTLASGVVVYTFRRRFWQAGERVLRWPEKYGAEAGYNRIFEGTLSLAKWQTKALQTGRLHDYLFVIVGATAVLVGWALLRVLPGLEGLHTGAFDPAITVLLVIISVATALVVVSDRYFTILGGLGTIGFGIALLFAYYGAPDLAITQLMVEALVVVLFMFVIYGLPPIRRFSERAVYRRDASLAIVFGLMVAILAWLAVGLQFDQPISDQLAAMSYPDGKGKNVVNVILVDFRALDTFGEITVVASAALGIAALLSSRRGSESKKKGNPAE